MAGRERGRGRSSGTTGASAPRRPTVRVRTAKGRKPSSTRWLHRQLNDPYVVAAGRCGYRSRAAWKLVEIDDRFALLRPGAAVVDLGAAPGGWTQVALQRVRTRSGGGRVLAVDTRDMAPMDGAAFLRLDIGDPDQAERLVHALAGGCDVVLSDMAAAATGHRPTDRIRNRILAETACDLARRVLRPDGGLVVKVFDGGGAAPLMGVLKGDFTAVRIFKPAASRGGSAETYIVARGFRGAAHPGPARLGFAAG